jgi:stearoyl-CoA desaturase (delta-9 desaturase)
MTSLFLNGLLGNFPWVQVIYTIVMVQITILAVTVYLHRFAAHRALDLHPSVQHFFRFWVFFTTGMKTREWVAVHRRHHARCEQPDDPHSPVQLGFWYVLLLGVFAYTKSAKNPSIYRNAQDCPNDWIERHLYTPYNWSGVAVLFVINIILFGVWGVLTWAIQMWWIPFWAAGVINGIGHWYTPFLSRFKVLYQNWQNGDLVPDKWSRRVGEERFTNIWRSANIVPFALWIGGEELHANHHAFPSSPKFSYKWYEVDVGWGVICILRALKLASLKHNTLRL